MQDPLDKNWTTWDTLRDYALGIGAGVVCILLGLTKGVALLVAALVFGSWAVGKHLFRRWTGSDT